MERGEVSRGCSKSLADRGDDSLSAPINGKKGQYREEER